MTAPVPIVDSTDKPILLTAVTLTVILEPHCKLNGAAIKVENGIKHF